MFGRLVSHPKLRTVNGQPRHDCTAGILNTVNLDRIERLFVELDGSCAVSNRQQWRNRNRNRDGDVRAHCVLLVMAVPTYQARFCSAKVLDHRSCLCCSVVSSMREATVQTCPDGSMIHAV